MKDEPVLGLKLLLSYDVNGENIQEYYQFVMGRYLPAMQSMGLQMIEAWHTAYGDLPNRLIGFVTPDHETMMKVLKSDDWDTLNTQLLEFVSDFSFKVIPYRGGFQI